MHAFLQIKWIIIFNYKTINFNFYKFRTIAFATIAISQHLEILIISVSNN